jgi:NTE family protein
MIAKGLTPDIITGTSIGAVVGGCYAAGKLDEVEQWGRSLTRRTLLSYLDVSFSGSGLLSGGRLFDKLAEAIGDVAIEDLAARFASIATEIGTGHEIWVTRGRLIDALRASYSLPGIFPPVRLGERWLMDGALVNPVPVSAARALGARVVIAVNVNTDLFGRGTTIHDHGASAEAEAPAEDISANIDLLAKASAIKAAKRQFLGTTSRPGISAVMVEAFNVMQDRITRSRLAGDPPDILVSPRVGKIGLFDFHRAEEAIALGADAAEKSLEQVDEVIAALA